LPPTMKPRENKKRRTVLTRKKETTKAASSEKDGTGKLKGRKHPLQGKNRQTTGTQKTVLGRKGGGGWVGTSKDGHTTPGKCSIEKS